ncbi:UNVERIFIED_CONTAM: Protein ERGIC-53 [Siphonaria sp. JEL0065]|nr:Protein ERGIC-53 [Siphonaria sp. JEL0065]
MDAADVGRRYVPLIYGYNSEHGNQKLEGSLRAPPENYSGFLGKCFRDYRNTPHKVFARVSYIGKTLKFEMDLNQEGNGYSECFSTSNVNLPIGYHFGISASTSQFTHDDHDVFSFEVYETNPSGKASKLEENQGLPSDPEQLKLPSLKNLIQMDLRRLSVLQPCKSFQNQEKMINSINLLEEKLGLAPIIAARLAKHHYDRSTDIVLSQVDGKTGYLGDASIKAVGEALERQNLQLDSTFELAKTTTVGSGSGSGWLMYLAFFAVGGGVFAAVRNEMVSRRSPEAEPCWDIEWDIICQNYFIVL